MKKYLSLIKFSHTIFALPFAAVGFSLAVKATGSGLSLQKLIAVVLCMVFARSAAMAFNRYLDRRFDALNPRTATREIPAGQISPRNALLFTISSSVLFIATTWAINPLCFALSFVALAVILFYSYTKLFTPLCHLVLGVGLALAPIGAYLAVTGEFATLPVLLSGAVFCWVAGFDIIYALQDEAFDRAQGLHSIPEALGGRNALLVSRLLHACAAALIITVGIYGQLHPLYWAAAAVFIGLLLYQHSIVSPADLSRVNLAFGTTNGIASVLFAVGTIGALLLS
ncbi:MAG: 4-hydroxybenzoate octaprenyltransferase [Sphingobacteriales bacterium]|nr:MAG: 4-hydroxybenzoate octaprenyltransferase [Sphingobacteriales bacterium]